MAQVVVVGAGIVGLCCAYSLRRRGLDVVVLDRAQPGRAASHGNLGWVVPVLSGPVPAPGLIGTSLRWLLQPHSPLYIRPRPDPAFLRWMWAFRRACNARDYARSLEAVAWLNARTFELYDAMAADGVEFEMHRSGLLFLFRSVAAAEAERHELSCMEAYGSPPPRWLDPPALRRELPAVSSSVVAGFLAPQERNVHPGSLSAGLVRRLAAMGVEVRAGKEVQGFGQVDGRVSRVRTSRGSIDASHVVLAAGIWTTRLAAMLGLRIPMEAGKGYSVTMSPPPLPIARPLYLGDTRVGVSPLAGAVRIGGTMELSGLNYRLDPRRVAALTTAVQSYLDGWQTTRVEETWTGMRPLTPDGLPAIGTVPAARNVVVATGHAMLGVTLGPATGEVVADLVTTDARPAMLAAFSPARFRQ